MAERENFSRKREAICNAVMATKVHPTAEWIYSALKPDYPDLSLGTVYRNLKKLCESGKIISLGVIKGQEHFDGDISKHSHFVCNQCGCVLDVFEELLSEQTLSEIEEKYALAIDREDVVFTGTCSKCQS